MNNILKDFKDVLKYIDDWSVRIGRIPSKTEINNDEHLKSGSTVHRQYKKETGVTFIEYYKNKGYSEKIRPKQRPELAFKDLYEELYNECLKLKRIPNIDELKNHSSLPSSFIINSMFQENLNQSYVEHLKSKGFNIGNQLTAKADEFEQTKHLLIEKAKELGKIPSYEEIENDALLPSPYALKSLFIYKTSEGYIPFLEKMGFEVKQKYNSILNQISFEELRNKLIDCCKELKRIPSKVELKSLGLPSAEALRHAFEVNSEYDGYIPFCKEKGYEISFTRSKFYDHTFEDFEQLWLDYYDINGKYPTSEDCYKHDHLPSWDRLRNTLGERFNEFYSKYGNGNIHNKKDYNLYCEKFKALCMENGKVLTSNDLNKNSYGLPNYRWFVEYCPDDSVTDYNKFVSYLGLKSYYMITKEYATEAIKRKRIEVGRNLKKSDFDNPSHDEIGISTIYNHWGNFNNMLISLGYEINQEVMRDKARPIEELKSDIDRLCLHIKNTEDRTTISRDDINECEWCLTAQTYDRMFRKDLNLTLSEYITSLGYRPNKAGMGTVHKFEDGEITTSRYEFEMSNFLRASNINYSRNIPYSEFIEGYVGLKDCDYLIDNNGSPLYVEIAGMLNREKMSKNNKIHLKYKKDLDDKIKMLIDADLNYLVIYPHDLKDKSYEDIFSFLNINKINIS
ncbi:homing endonuclease associated repeat-containing protein [Priestia megaterium]|uniref:homing endonuclease associated repeat-containing protein n=1 Tax=Priestia megaterium TaxID=1404 RepID=UPI002878125A|nr:hypothetical protein [Priestia megaterium]